MVLLLRELLKLSTLEKQNLMISDLSFGICYNQNQRGVFLRIQSETPNICWEVDGEMCRLHAHHGVKQDLLFFAV